PVPEHRTAATIDEALERARELSYPLMLRPSYVLGGQAMTCVYDEAALRAYLDRHPFDEERPLFLDRFLEGAVEVDVDALCDGTAVWIAGIQQHVERAGIHSGDSTSLLPAEGIPTELLERIRERTNALALALGAVGLLNVQFAIQGGEAYVLEANPRASRTIPFVSKAIGQPLARLATRILLGGKIADLGLPALPVAPRSFVKMPVFPFRRFPENDTILGPEMRSTGEVLGIAPSFGSAFAKACLAAGLKLPLGGRVFLSVNDNDKPAALDVARALARLDFVLTATHGTAAWLQRSGIPCTRVYKVNEGHPNVVDRIRGGKIDLVINTPLGRASFYDERAIRSTALERGVPCITTLEGARAAAEAIASMRESGIEVEALQEIHRRGVPSDTQRMPRTPAGSTAGRDAGASAAEGGKRERASGSPTKGFRFRPLAKGETNRPSEGHQGGT
ncbi:MAG: hypothetical protein QUU85_07290, partial [Candidatus Eisenbacteria bacterium]|nr:hypothetical protein [Candidatus Eisenbacteria bacterium]